MGRVDTSRTRTERALRFVLMMKDTSHPVRIETLNRDDWGCPRTVKRMIDEVNIIWEMLTGQPFVEELRTGGPGGGRAMRRLLPHDVNWQDGAAALGVLLSMSPELRGTWVHDAADEVLASLAGHVDPLTARQIRRMREKTGRRLPGASAAGAGLRAKTVDRVLRAVRSGAAVAVTWRDAGRQRSARCEIIRMTANPADMILEVRPMDDPGAAAREIPLSAVVHVSDDGERDEG